MKKILILALLLTACEPVRDVFEGWNDNPALAAEMLKRGFEMRGHILHMNTVPVFEISSCNRCDNTIFLGPREAEKRVIEAFLKSYEESRVAVEQQFLQSVGLPPTTEIKGE